MTRLSDYQQAMVKMLSNKQLLAQSSRLMIYRNSSQGGRIKALTHQFPCCEKLVGETAWQHLAESFVTSVLSQHVAIHEDAELFIQFLEQHPWLESVPYLHDMAIFEWYWYQVFHHVNNPAIDYQKLHQQLQETGVETRLGTAEGLKLLISSYPLHELWLMCQPNYSGDYQYADEATTYYLAIVQREGAVYIEKIDQLGHAILALLAQPMSLALLAEQYELTYAEPMPQETVVVLYQRGLLYTM